MSNAQNSAEANRILNGLASMPSAIYTAVNRAVVREIMLQTGGRLLAHGHVHDVISKPLGGGVYRITLRRI